MARCEDISSLRTKCPRPAEYLIRCLLKSTKILWVISLSTKVVLNCLTELPTDPDRGCADPMSMLGGRMYCGSIVKNHELEDSRNTYQSECQCYAQNQKHSCHKRTATDSAKASHSTALSRKTETKLCSHMNRDTLVHKLPWLSRYSFIGPYRILFFLWTKNRDI